MAKAAVKLDAGDAFAAVDISFGKTQILRSQKYRERRDLLSSALNDGEEYSLREVDGIVRDFLKGNLKGKVI